MSSSVFKFFEKKENYLWVLRVSHSIIKNYGYKDYDSAKDLAQEVFLKLAESSSRINFPKVQDDARKYIQTTIKREWISKLRKLNKMPINTLDEKKVFTGEESKNEVVPTALKVDELNNLILTKSHRFTEQQLKLWECINLALPLEKICFILERDSKSISKLKYKLENKILKEFHVELKNFY